MFWVGPALIHGESGILSYGNKGSGGNSGHRVIFMKNKYMSQTFVYNLRNNYGRPILSKY